MHARYQIQFFFLLLIFTFPNFVFSVQNNHHNSQPTVTCVGDSHYVENKSSNQCSDESSTMQNSAAFFVGSIGSDRSGCPESSSAAVSPEAIVQQAVAYVIYDAYCKQYFHMSAQEKHDLMSCWRYKTFATKLLEYKDLEENIAWELLDEFVKLKKLHGDDLQECKKTIKYAFKHKNAEKIRKQNKLLLQQQQEAQRLQEQQAKDREIAFIKEQQEAEQLFFDSLYDGILPIRADYSSPYQVQREEALQKTKVESFVQYDKSYALTPQVEAYLKLQNLDSNIYREFFGTSLQQEFHQELCDIFGQAAMLQLQLPYTSDFLRSSVLFADAAHEANCFEQISLVVSLTDVGIELLDAVKKYGHAIGSGVLKSVGDFVQPFIHPVETIESISKALYFVFETAALNNYREEYGFQDLYIPLRDQRNAEIIAGLKSLAHGISQSTGPQRVEALAHFCATFFVPSKIVQAVGSVLGVIQSQAKIVQKLEGVVAIAGEQTGVQNIAHEAWQVTSKVESVAQESLVQKTAVKLMNAEKQFDQSVKPISANSAETIRKLKATPPRTLADKKASALKKAQRLAVKVKELPDGRIRYYELEAPSKMPGPTRGRSYVTEFDSKNNCIRQWNECYDHAGNVNRVRPTMIDGRDVVSQHYPATYKDIQNNRKGSKWLIPEKNLD